MVLAMWSVRTARASLDSSSSKTATATEFFKASELFGIFRSRMCEQKVWGKVIVAQPNDGS